MNGASYFTTALRFYLAYKWSLAAWPKWPTFHSEAMINAAHRQLQQTTNPLLALYDRALQHVVIPNFAWVNALVPIGELALVFLLLWSKRPVPVLLVALAINVNFSLLGHFQLNAPFLALTIMLLATYELAPTYSLPQLWQLFWRNRIIH